MKKALGPRLPASSFASGADYAIDHVAIDMPVKMPTEEVAMPIATVFLSTRSAAVIGLALSTAGPSFPGAAFATVIALSNGLPDYAPSVGLALELFPGRDWDRLEAALRLTGMQILSTKRSVLGRGGPAATLLGDRHHGIRLRPRLTTRTAADRAATMPTGASPLTLSEAEDLLRERWIIKAVLCGRVTLYAGSGSKMDIRACRVDSAGEKVIRALTAPENLPKTRSLWLSEPDARERLATTSQRLRALSMAGRLKTSGNFDGRTFERKEVDALALDIVSPNELQAKLCITAWELKRVLRKAKLADDEHGFLPRSATRDALGIATI